MSRPRHTNARKDRRRRQRAWPDRVDQANAAYDKAHGGSKVIGALRQLGSAGTQAAFPARPEHRTTPPWESVPGDPPLPGSGPREDLIAVARTIDASRPMFAFWED